MVNLVFSRNTNLTTYLRAHNVNRYLWSAMEGIRITLFYASEP